MTRLLNLILYYHSINQCLQNSFSGQGVLSMKPNLYQQWANRRTLCSHTLLKHIHSFIHKQTSACKQIHKANGFEVQLPNDTRNRGQRRTRHGQAPTCFVLCFLLLSWPKSNRTRAELFCLWPFTPQAPAPGMPLPSPVQVRTLWASYNLRLACPPWHRYDHSLPVSSFLTKFCPDFSLYIYHILPGAIFVYVLSLSQASKIPWSNL